MVCHKTGSSLVLRFYHLVINRCLDSKTFLKTGCMFQLDLFFSTWLFLDFSKLKTALFRYSDLKTH